MKRLVLLSVLVASFFSSVGGAEEPKQDEERQKIVVEIMRVTNQTEILRLMRPLSARRITELVLDEGIKITAEEAVQLEKIITRIVTEYEDEAFALTMQLMYKNFTLEELRDLLSFYETELGTKMIAAMPEMMAKVMEWQSEQMQVMIPRITEEFVEILEARERDRGEM